VIHIDRSRRPKSKKEIMKKRLIVITALCLALAPAAIAQAEKQKAEATIYLPGDVVWKDAAGIPPGAKIAVLEGDPGKEGYYVIRVKYPEGLYKIPPHTHPQTEHRPERRSDTACRGLYVSARWSEAFCLDNGRDGHPTERNWSLGHQLLGPSGRPSERKEIVAFGKPRISVSIRQYVNSHPPSRSGT
jgi:hypothetical protein